MFQGGTYQVKVQYLGFQPQSIEITVVAGKKLFEAIAVDKELEYVYYQDEIAGFRKYYVDSELKDNSQLAFFG